jgi:hypothetical protein
VREKLKARRLFTSQDFAQSVQGNSYERGVLSLRARFLDLPAYLFEQFFVREYRIFRLHPSLRLEAMTL